jgi:hypothetical protein
LLALISLIIGSQPQPLGSKELLSLVMPRDTGLAGAERAGGGSESGQEENQCRRAVHSLILRGDTEGKS